MARDAGGFGQLDDRAHLRAEHALLDGRARAGRRARDRLHELHAVGLVRQALVDLEERHDLLDRPQVLGGAAPSISRSIVFSKRIAPMIRSPVKAGLVMMRVRISWMRSYISVSFEYASSPTP
jgi:hypothetical protein